MKFLSILLIITSLGFTPLLAGKYLSPTNEVLLAKAADSSMGLASVLNRAALDAKWSDETTEEIFKKLIALHKQDSQNKIKTYLFERYCGKVINRNTEHFGLELQELFEANRLKTTILAQKYRLRNIQ